MIKGPERERFRGFGVPLATALLFVAACPSPGRSQIVQGPPVRTLPGADSSHPAQRGLEPPEPTGPLAASNASRLEHLREDDRHKRIVADTARLVALTNELKEDVEKASKDQLSLDVVRKAAEIEKLARDVKERMKS